MGSFGFFIDLIPPAYKKKDYQEYLLRNKGGQCVRLILTPKCANYLEILEASNFWSPTGLSRPVMG
jgi:hypothetical protein